MGKSHVVLNNAISLVMLNDGIELQIHEGIHHLAPCSKCSDSEYTYSPVLGIDKVEGMYNFLGEFINAVKKEKTPEWKSIMIHNKK